jgi:hypothetical protein
MNTNTATPTDRQDIFSWDQLRTNYNPARRIQAIVSTTTSTAETSGLGAEVQDDREPMRLTDGHPFYRNGKVWYLAPFKAVHKPARRFWPNQILANEGCNGFTGFLADPRPNDQLGTGTEAKFENASKARDIPIHRYK